MVVPENNLTTVVFDLDETLIDRSAALAGYVHTLWQARYEDLDEAALTRQVIELDQHGYRPRDVFFAEMRKRYAQILPSQLIEHAFYQQVWQTPQLAEGAIGWLDYLACKHIPMGLVSNGSTQAQETKLNRSGIKHYFDVVVISEAFGKKKPDAAIFTHALERLSANVATSWFVGDHPHNDIWASKQVGFRTGWVSLGRPWSCDYEPCYDVHGQSLNETMKKISDTL